MSNKSVKENKEIIDRVEEVLQAAYKENEEFNTALNAEEPLRIPSVKPDRPPYVLETSEILFWTDRNAYYDELEYWEEIHIQEVHEQTIQQLKSNDQVPVFYDLADAIRRNRIAPFIGAGMSQPTGFPLWGSALEQLRDRLDGVDAGATSTALQSFDYLKAAQILWDHDSTQVNNFIRTKFAERQIPQGGVQGPIMLLPKISRGCMITTNFDCVIETVIGKGNLDGYMHGVQQGNKFVPKLIKGDRCILKLHGDAEDHATYVFTGEQYKDAYGAPFDFSKPLPKALRQIFISHSLLFLGCSLEQDKTLELFKCVCEDRQFEIPDHFAILSEPEGTEKKNQKEGRLLEMKIRPIWYPAGQHDFVEKYLHLAIEIAEGRITAL